MKNIKINVKKKKKVFLNLSAEINILEAWNIHGEKSSEIELILKNIQESLLELENMVYDIDDTD